MLRNDKTKSFQTYYPDGEEREVIRAELDSVYGTPLYLRDGRMLCAVRLVIVDAYNFRRSGFNAYINSDDIEIE